MLYILDYMGLSSLQPLFSSISIAILIALVLVMIVYTLFEIRKIKKKLVNTKTKHNR